jgi:hypothetical protein
MTPRGPFDERTVNGRMSAGTLVGPYGPSSPGNGTVTEAWVNGR